MNHLYFEFEPTAAYLDDAKRELFVSRLSTARAARIRAPRLVSRRAERAAAEAALRRACRAAGEAYASLTIAYTEEGKPYIEGRHDLTLSVSHTPYLAAVVLVKSDTGDAPAVGLDIAACEEASRDAARLADRYFSTEERAALYEAMDQKGAENLGSAPSNDVDLSSVPPHIFLPVWCRMEARVKMTGEGIGSGRTPCEPAERRAFTLSQVGIPAHYVAIALTAPVT